MCKTSTTPPCVGRRRRGVLLFGAISYIGSGLLLRISSDVEPEHGDTKGDSGEEDPWAVDDVSLLLPDEHL